LKKNGFIWNDFHLNKCGKLLFTPGRGFILPKDLTQFLLAEIGVNFLFRGHQHGAEYPGLLWKLIQNNGLVPLWDEEDKKRIFRNGEEVDLRKEPFLVYTLISCPASDIVFEMDSFVEITIHSLKKWTMKHHYGRPENQSFTGFFVPVISLSDTETELMLE